MSASRFRGQVVVITGASSGVGRSLARVFGAWGVQARTALNPFFRRPPGGVFGLSLALGGLASLCTAALLRRQVV